ncbi:MAG: YCF48-related protein [Balneolaceae bacterium]
MIFSSPAIAQEWTLVESVTDSTLHGVYFVDRNIGWAVGDGGTIIHSSDGGKNWAPQESGTTNQLNNVYFFDEFTGWIAGNDNLVLYTENGGKEWTERRPTSVSGQRITDISFTDWKRGWSAGGPGGHIYYTDNAGLSWDRQASLNPNSTISAIESINHQTAYASVDNQLFFTDNKGEEWEEHSSLSESEFESLIINDIHFVNDTLGWAIGNNENAGVILRSNNSGNRWNEVQNIHSKGKSIRFIDQETGMLVGDNGIALQTNDGGINWERVGIETEIDLNDIAFSDSGSRWIVGEQGVIYHYVKPEVPDISFYRDHYPSVEIANESEAVELLQRAQLYGDSALAQEDPTMRISRYGRLLASTDQVEHFFGNPENEYSSHIPVLLNHYWAVEHNEGAKIFNEWLEQEGSPQQIEKSKAHLQNAILIQPDSAFSHISLSYVNHKLNDIPVSISSMETAISLMEVPDLKHYTFLIELYQSEERLSEGLELNQKAIEHYPEENTLYELLVNLYLNQGEIEEAVDYLAMLIEWDNDNPNYYFIRGAQLQYMALNKLEEALRLYEEVWALREELQTDPADRDEIENRIGSLMQEVNELESEGTEYADQAVSDLDNVAELDPESYDVDGIIGSIYHNRASIFYQMRTLTADQNEAQRFDSTMANNLEEAKTHYEQAVTQNPDEPAYWEALYYIYLDLGLEDQAEQIVRNENFDDNK